MSRVEIGSKPASAILSIVRGDQWRRAMFLTDGADPFDATGATLSATVTKTIGGDEIFAPAIAAVDATEGEFTIDITEAQSDLLTAAAPNDPKGQHWLTILIVDSAEVTTTLARVRMQVLQ